MPERQGTDRIVDVHGNTAWTLSDSMTRNIVLPISSDSLLVVDHNSLDLWNKRTGLKSFEGIVKLRSGAVSVIAPGGTAALVGLWGSAVYAKWRR